MLSDTATDDPTMSMAAGPSTVPLRANGAVRIG